MTAKRLLAISTPSTLKAASLLFDKVFLIELPTKDDSSSAELKRYLKREKPEWLLQRAVLKLDKGYGLRSREEGVLGMGGVAEALAQIAYREYNVVPVYKTVIDLERDLAPETGDSGPDAVTGFLAALSFIQQPDSTKLSWKKINGFREDATSVAKYRALRTWLRRALTASSVAEAEDRIFEVVKDVDLAFQKHSIETWKGSFQLLFDYKTLATSVPLAAAGHLSLGPVWPALVAGFMAAGRIHCHLKERRFVLKEHLRANDLEAAAVLSEMRNLSGA